MLTDRFPTLVTANEYVKRCYKIINTYIVYTIGKKSDIHLKSDMFEVILITVHFSDAQKLSSVDNECSDSKNF